MIRIYRTALAGIAVASIVVMLGGCTAAPAPLPPQDVDPVHAASLNFDYVPEGGSGSPDQVLEIENTGTVALAPGLDLFAFDSQGNRLQDVTVSTVFGSHEGRLVVPPGVSADVLRFEGYGADLVADVVVSVFQATVVAYPKLTSQPYLEGRRGMPVDANKPLTWVDLTNDNDEAATVRMVYVVWDKPVAGRTRQAMLVLPIGGLKKVPARGHRIVTLISEVASANRKYAGVQPASVLVYLSH